MWRVFASPWFVAAWSALVVLVVVARTLFYLRIRAHWQEWQPVSATILESHINAYTDMDGEYVRSPTIRFSYEFQGKEYTSDEPVLRSFSLGPKFINLTEVIERYSKGDTVTARLHPRFPEFCYLEVERFDFKSLFLTVAGLIALGAGSYGLARFLGA